MYIAAPIALVLIGLFALFQLALASGAPFGHFAWGGKYRVLPKKLRISSLVAVVIFGVFAAFILSKTDWLPIINNQFVVQVGLWVIFAYLVIMILANGVSQSKYERYTMTPITALLAVCFLVVAIS